MLLDLRNSRLVASSGVRRLQLYKLQEEALVKNAVKEAVKKVEEAETPAIVSPPAKPKKIKPVVRKKRPAQQPQSIKPLVLAPVKTLPTAYEELAALPPLIFEQIIWRVQSTQVIISLDKERQRRRRKKVAAVLLMAA